MENNYGGGFTTSDAVLTAAMSGGLGGNRYGGGQWGGGGYGFMQPGNSCLAAEAHANGTATKEAINGVSDTVRLGFDSNQEQIRESRTIDQFTRLGDNQFRTEIRSSDQHAALTKSLSDAEFRSIDRQRDIERLVLEGQKEAAKCCCEAKLQACKDHAELKALTIAENSATRELIRGDALVAANARITQLETINALQENGGGHHGRR